MGAESLQSHQPAPVHPQECSKFSRNYLQLYLRTRLYSPPVWESPFYLIVTCEEISSENIRRLMILNFSKALW